MLGDTLGPEHDDGPRSHHYVSLHNIHYAHISMRAWLIVYLRCRLSLNRVHNAVNLVHTSYDVPALDRLPESSSNSAPTLSRHSTTARSGDR